MGSKLVLFERLCNEERMRKFILCLISCVSVSAFATIAKADIKSLPAALKSSAAVIETSHNSGVGVFFRSLEEDCDSPMVLDNKFIRTNPRPGAIALFRVESRVEASCLRREIWHCRSVFEGSGQNAKFTYKYTDCETDAPLIED